MAASLFQDGKGNVSSMRVVWSFTIVVIIATWAYISIVANQLQSFSTGDALWITALFGGKVSQSWVEAKYSSGSETPSTDVDQAAPPSEG